MKELAAHFGLSFISGSVTRGPLSLPCRTSWPRSPSPLSKDESIGQKVPISFFSDKPVVIARTSGEMFSSIATPLHVSFAPIWAPKDAKFIDMAAFSIALMLAWLPSNQARFPFWSFLIRWRAGLSLAKWMPQRSSSTSLMVVIKLFIILNCVIRRRRENV